MEETERILILEKSMILILLTLCSQPAGFIVETPDTITLYHNEAFPYIVPEISAEIEDMIILPLDVLTKNSNCA